MLFVKQFGSIRFFVEHVGGLFFDTKNYERRETRVGDKDIFLEKSPINTAIMVVGKIP